MHTHAYTCFNWFIGRSFWYVFYQFYMKTGKCKFGATCKFHHPKDIQIQASAQENDSTTLTGLVDNSEMIDDVKQTVSPAMLHNSKGLPIRPVIHRFSTSLSPTPSPHLFHPPVLSSNLFICSDYWSTPYSYFRN